MVSKPKIKTEEEITEPILGWRRVEEYLAEGGVSGLIAALIEADKLLDYHLSEKGYPGENLEEKIHLAGVKFSHLSGLLEARKIRNEILEKVHHKITTLDLEEALAFYKQALLDLALDEEYKIPFFERLFIYLQYWWPKKKKTLKRSFLLLITSVAVIWLLANTSFGQGLVDLVIGLVNLIFSWVFAVLLLVLGVIAVIGLTIFYFEKKKRGR